MSVDSSCAPADGRRLGRDRGERVAVTLPGLQVVVGRHGPLPAGVDLEVQVRRRADGVARVADEADDVARVDVRAVRRRSARRPRGARSRTSCRSCPRSTAASRRAGSSRRCAARRSAPRRAACPRARTGRSPRGSPCRRAGRRSRGRSARRRRPGRRSSGPPVAAGACGSTGGVSREAARRRGLDAGRRDAVARVGRRLVARRQRHDGRAELQRIGRGLAAARVAPPSAGGRTGARGCGRDAPGSGAAGGIGVAEQDLGAGRQVVPADAQVHVQRDLGAAVGAARAHDAALVDRAPADARDLELRRPAATETAAPATTRSLTRAAERARWRASCAPSA